MTTRPVKDIQRAHDLLVPILTREVPFDCDPDTRSYIHAVTDVLCWVLEHEHNPAFAANLEAIEQDLVKRGFPLIDHGN